jgi:ATP dependent DNA ligase domain
LGNSPDPFEELTVFERWVLQRSADQACGVDYLVQAYKGHLDRRAGVCLQPRFQKQAAAPTLYFAFDVLWSDGSDITKKPLMERRRVLESIIKPMAGIQVGTYVEGEGKAVFDITKQKGMQWIIAKRKEIIYRPGKPTSDWLKIKARLQQVLWLEASLPLSPLKWEHINLTGDYHWRRDSGLRNRKLRPLRNAFAPPTALP